MKIRTDYPQAEIRNTRMLIQHAIITASAISSVTGILVYHQLSPVYVFIEQVLFLCIVSVHTIYT
jgi:hypothetical protein